MSTQAVTHHGNRLPRCSAAGYVKRVAAQAANQLNIHIGIGTGDKEAIIACGSIHHHPLNATEGNEQARSIHAGRCDHKVIAELGAQHRQRIEPVAAGNSHRRIDGEADKVSALTAIDIGKWRFWIIRIHAYKGAHQEVVVILFAKQRERGCIVIYRKRIAAGAAIERSRETDAVTEITLGGQRRIKLILGGKACCRITR